MERRKKTVFHRVRHFDVAVAVAAFQKIYDFNLTVLALCEIFLILSSINFCCIFLLFFEFQRSIRNSFCLDCAATYDLRHSPNALNAIEHCVFERHTSNERRTERNIPIRHIVLSVIALVEPKIGFNANELCDCNQFYIAAWWCWWFGCRLSHNFGSTQARNAATHSLVGLP